MKALQWQHSFAGSSINVTEGDSPPRVAVINGVGFHTEVYCALLWGFTQAGATPTAFVLKEATGRIEHVIAEWCVPPSITSKIPIAGIVPARGTVC
jgi:hypothetical protein